MGFWSRGNWKVTGLSQGFLFSPKTPFYFKDSFQFRLQAYYVGDKQFESVLECFFHQGGKAYIAKSAKEVEGAYILPKQRYKESPEVYLKRVLPFAFRLSVQYWNTLGVEEILQVLDPESLIWNPTHWEKSPSRKGEHCKQGEFHFKTAYHKDPRWNRCYFDLVYRKHFNLRYPYVSSNPNDFETRLREAKKELESLRTFMQHIQDTL